MEDITRVVLTGGPCAGKTTILARIKDHFTGMGYQTIIVPEAASMVINLGFIPAMFPGDSIFEFQDAVLEVTLSLQNQAERLARHLRKYPTLLVFDRGSLDGKAYCTPAAWARILSLRNLTEAQLRDAHYHSVIHLVSAADGAEASYTLLNNSARLETLEAARIIDRQLQAAWAAHPRFRVVDNSTDFEGKIKRTLEIVREVLWDFRLGHTDVKVVRQRSRAPGVESLQQEG